MAKRKTKKELEIELANWKKTAEQQNERIGRLEEGLSFAQQRSQELTDANIAHVGVLQGDRDALTRTIEVLSRRLASPGADKDPSRAGWRANTPAMSMSGEKAMDPAFLRRR